MSPVRGHSVDRRGCDVLFCTEVVVPQLHSELPGVKTETHTRNVIRSVSKVLRNTSIRYRTGLIDINAFCYMNNIHENMFFIATFIYWHPIGLIFYIFPPLYLVFFYLVICAVLR